MPYIAEFPSGNAFEVEDIGIGQSRVRIIVPVVSREAPFFRNFYTLYNEERKPILETQGTFDLGTVLTPGTHEVDIFVQQQFPAVQPYGTTLRFFTVGKGMY